jgi:hypothetical protein
MPMTLGLHPGCLKKLANKAIAKDHTCDDRCGCGREYECQKPNFAIDSKALSDQSPTQ